MLTTCSPNTDVFKALLVYCYSGKLPYNLPILCELLKVTDAYHLTRMKAACGQLLGTWCASNEVVLTYLEMANNLQLRRTQGDILSPIID